MHPCGGVGWCMERPSPGIGDWLCLVACQIALDWDSSGKHFPVPTFHQTKNKRQRNHLGPDYDEFYVSIRLGSQSKVYHSVGGPIKYFNRPLCLPNESIRDCVGSVCGSVLAFPELKLIIESFDFNNSKVVPWPLVHHPLSGEPQP